MKVSAANVPVIGMTARRRGLGTLLAVCLSVSTAFGLTQLVEAESPCTISVGPGESIQAAIDRAAPSTVICLAAGVYRESIRISKSMVLRGAGQGALETTLIGKERETRTVLIQTPDPTVPCEVQLEHLSMGSECPDKNGIVVLLIGSCSVTIRDCTVLSSRGVGIEVGDSATALIERTAITQQLGYAGVYFGGSSKVTVRGCQITGNPEGNVEVTGSAVALVEDSLISGPEEGFWITDDAVVTVTRCEVSGNGVHGLAIDGHAQVLVSDCVVSRNHRYGIAVYGHAMAAVRGSQVTDNRLGGISIGETAHAELVGNTVQRNEGWGVVWQGNAERCTCITGCGNTIGDTWGPGGNKDGAVRPIGLRSLRRACAS